MNTFRIYQWTKLQKNRRQARPRLQQQIQQRWLLAGLIGLSILITLPLLLLGTTLSGYLNQVPDLAQIPALFSQPDGAFFQPTVLYDRSGNQLIYKHDHPSAPRTYRSLDPASSDGMSPYLIQTMLTLNEPDYWNSNTVQTLNWFSPEPQSLAERLVDHFILKPQTQGLQRAIQLRTLGQQLIQSYGKNQVLEWYLNSAYFGQKAYGVESAAQLYFQKSAAELNFAESVLLAAIEQAPALNPLDSPAASQTLYHETLKIIYERGALNVEEFTAAQEAPPVLQIASLETQLPYRAFSTRVMQQLMDEYGIWRVGFGGFNVKTTLDMDLQQQLSCVIELQLKRLKQPVDVDITTELDRCPAAYYLPALPAFQEPLTTPLTASGLIQDVSNGQVLAYLGDHQDGVESVNETRHQAGTLLSPILSTALISRGYSPSSLVWDIPPAEENQKIPAINPLTEFHGPQRLRYAVANDSFYPMIGLYQAIGGEAFFNTAIGLSLNNPALRSSPAHILVQGDSASILEISQAYQPIANLGLQYGIQNPQTGMLEPVFTLDVQQANNDASTPSSVQERAVLSPGLAYVVHHMLQDETARWPSLGYPNPTEIGRPAGVKIGRTAAQDESWALGYTRQRLITIWLGQPGVSKPQPLSWEPAAGIWNALMKYAGKNLPSESWQMPGDVSLLEVCDPSGKLPTVDCPNPVNEVFIMGNEPIAYDDLYRSVQINRETGYLATVYTPLELVEEKTFLMLPDFAKAWAEQEGIEQPPEMYDTLMTSPGTAQAQIAAPAAYSIVNGRVDIMGSASGENFKSYRLQVGEGLNPRTWLQISEEQTTPVENGKLGTWQTEKDGLYAIRLSVVREDQSLETHVVQVTVDNTIPSAKITFPGEGSQLESDGSTPVYLQVQAEDAIGLKNAAWILDGQWIADSSEAPYGILWMPEAGAHTLVVKVTDSAGNLGISNVINFKVINKP